MPFFVWPGQPRNLGKTIPVFRGWIKRIDFVQVFYFSSSVRQYSLTTTGRPAHVLNQRRHRRNTSKPTLATGRSSTRLLQPGESDGRLCWHGRFVSAYCCPCASYQEHVPNHRVCTVRGSIRMDALAPSAQTEHALPTNGLRTLRPGHTEATACVRTCQSTSRSFRIFRMATVCVGTAPTSGS